MQENVLVFPTRNQNNKIPGGAYAIVFTSSIGKLLHKRNNMAIMKRASISVVYPGFRECGGGYFLHRRNKICCLFSNSKGFKNLKKSTKNLHLLEILKEIL